MLAPGNALSKPLKALGTVPLPPQTTISCVWSAKYAQTLRFEPSAFVFQSISLSPGVYHGDQLPAYHLILYFNTSGCADVSNFKSPNSFVRSGPRVIVSVLSQSKATFVRTMENVPSL